MASVEKRTRDGNVTWLARWRDPDGRQRKRSFARRAEAERYLTSVQHSILTGHYIDPLAGKTLFRDYAEAWRMAQVHRPTTSAHVETMLRRHAYPTFGDRPLSSIRASEVQGWVKHLGTSTEARGGLSPATVGVVHRLVAGVFRAAVKDRMIASSPCEGVRLPKREVRRVSPLATECVYALAHAVPDRYQALILLSAGTGLRQGEAFGLTVDRIDFLRRSLLVDRQLLLLPGRPPFLGPPKTPASHRTVPLPQVVVESLAEHLRKYPVGADGFVFTTSKGEPLRRTSFSAQIWRPAAKESRLEGVVFHELRHYYASLLIRHGESVKVVQSRLGHATAAETLDTYSHLWPDSEDQTRRAVDTVLGAAGAPSVPQLVNEKA